MLRAASLDVAVCLTKTVYPALDTTYYSYQEVQIILSSRGSGVRRRPDRVATCFLAQVRPDLIVPLPPAAVTVAMLLDPERLQ